MTYNYKFIYHVDKSDNYKALVEGKLAECKSSFDCYSTLIKYLIEVSKIKDNKISNENFKYLSINEESNKCIIFNVNKEDKEKFDLNISALIEDLLLKVVYFMGRLEIECEWREQDNKPIPFPKSFKPHIFANIWDYSNSCVLLGAGKPTPNHHQNICETNTCTTSIPLIAIYIKQSNTYENIEKGYCNKDCSNWDKCISNQSACIKFYNYIGQLFASPCDENQIAIFSNGEKKYEDDINLIQKKIENKDLMKFQADLYNEESHLGKNFRDSEYFKKSGNKLSKKNIKDINLNGFLKLLILIDPMSELYRYCKVLPEQEDSKYIWSNKKIGWLDDKTGETFMFRWNNVPGVDEKNLKDCLNKNYKIDCSKKIFTKNGKKN